MNCLQFALLFWDEHPEYGIYYDGDHAINLREPTGNFIPLENYGYEHILKSFGNTLYPVDRLKLKRYFDSCKKR